MGETERRRGVMLVLTLKNEDSDDMRRHCLDNMAHQRMCHVVAVRCWLLPRRGLCLLCQKGQGAGESFYSPGC
jgi:hypothetical protein